MLMCQSYVDDSSEFRAGPVCSGNGAAGKHADSLTCHACVVFSSVSEVNTLPAEILVAAMGCVSFGRTDPNLK